MSETATAERIAEVRLAVRTGIPMRGGCLCGEGHDQGCPAVAADQMELRALEAESELDRAVSIAEELAKALRGAVVMAAATPPLADRLAERARWNRLLARFDSLKASE